MGSRRRSREKGGNWAYRFFPGSRWHGNDGGGETGIAVGGWKDGKEGVPYRQRGREASGEAVAVKGKLQREAMVMAEAAQGTDVAGKETEPVRVIVWYDYI